MIEAYILQAWGSGFRISPWISESCVTARDFMHDAGCIISCVYENRLWCISEDFDDVVPVDDS